MADGSVTVDVKTDPHIHAVEAVRELAEVIPDIIAKGVKVEIDFSTMHSVGMTNVRRAVSVTFSRDDE